MIKLVKENQYPKSRRLELYKIMFNEIERSGKEVIHGIVDAVDRSIRAHSDVYSAFEETISFPHGNTKKLPDGKNAYIYSSKDGDITVTISGDIDGDNDYNAYVVVYIDTEDDERVYSKEYMYYTRFDKAVSEANHIAIACDDGKSKEEIIELCKSLGMERE